MVVRKSKFPKTFSTNQWYCVQPYPLKWQQVLYFYLWWDYKKWMNTFDDFGTIQNKFRRIKPHASPRHVPAVTIHYLTIYTIQRHEDILGLSLIAFHMLLIHKGPITSSIPFTSRRFNVTCKGNIPLYYLDTPCVKSLSFCSKCNSLNLNTLH